jgi:hypothetical protein
MTRLEFTKNICSLIIEMIGMGERPIIDFCKRSSDEQKRLYDAGLSKCDGINNHSQHEFGKAIDLYFLSEDCLHIVEPSWGHEHWHRIWEEKYGGKPAISWDMGHLE